MGVLDGKKIVLAVTGGIAAYKSAELARMLINDGAEVRAAMTESAVHFIGPLTFQTLTRAPVAGDLWAMDRPAEVGHVSLADWAEVVVIAPATANIIGKLASGIADDFLSTFLLAVKAPVVICPSMNVNMFEHPIVRANMDRLESIGCRIVQPASGHLACGYEGRGRLPELGDIVEEVRLALAPKDLAGLKVLVTAGPTREPWDDIRFLSNRSTGLMGLALARTARRRGAEVILVTGPVDWPPPYGIETHGVESTREMEAAVKKHMTRANVLVKAAAPGDFRPADRVSGKVKKTKMPTPIKLARNPDILAGIGQNKGDKVLVGFAAEAEDLIENAKAKLKAKNLDLIVANQIGAPGTAFAAPTNQVFIIDRAGQVQEVPLQTKEEVADRIWDRIAAPAGRKED